MFSFYSLRLLCLYVHSDGSRMKPRRFVLDRGPLTVDGGWILLRWCAVPISHAASRAFGRVHADGEFPPGAVVDDTVGNVFIYPNQERQII